MKVECAWCGFIIENSSIGPTSHGICPMCRKKMFTEHHSENDTKKNTEENNKDPGEKPENTDAE